MALTTVVTSGYLERLLPILKDLNEGSIGPLTLAMLVPSTVDDDFRSLVLASPGLDKMGLREATSLVLEKLRAGMGDEALRIDSVSIQRTDNLAVDALNRYFDIPQLGTVYKAIGSPLIGLDDPIMFLSRKLPLAA